MKIAAIALATAFTLSSTFALAHGHTHHHHMRGHAMGAASPNGTAGGKTSLSGTGSALNSAVQYQATPERTEGSKDRNLSGEAAGANGPKTLRER